MVTMRGTLLAALRQYWRPLVIVLTPFALLPVYFVDPGEESPLKFKCAYVILIMATLWTTEAMPLAITALIPVVFFPLLNVQSTGAVCVNYMRESVMMFVGGISLALAIEYSGLHRRIALRTMLLVGTSPWRLLLGLMITTMLLSCWIVINTAVAAMMLPIVNGLLDSLEEEEVVSTPPKKRLRKLFMLAVGYSANIGGTAVIIGSNPNLIARELLTAENVGQGGKYTDITFTSWFAYAFPIAVVNLALTWLWLGFTFLGSPRKSQSLPEDVQMHNFANLDAQEEPATRKKPKRTGIDEMLRTRLAELGSMSFHESCVLFLFVVVILLWFTRDPRIFPGWASLFPSTHTKIGDSSVALAVVLLMFTIPKSPRFVGVPDTGTVLNWPFIQSHLPWNVILLVGGGFALSDGASKSGLSAWVGDQLGSSALASLPSPVLLLIFLVTISCLTEVISNAACTNLLLPILIALSRRLNLHPLYLSLPGAIACQYAFMLPVSNPPNAVVFTAGEMRIVDMVRAGAVLNFICLAVLFGMNLSWGQLIFNFSDYEYASANVTSSALAT